MVNPLKKLNRYKKYALLLLITATVGLIASFVLTLEKITSPQGEAFGFANPLIGLISFSVIITIAMGMFAGAKYKRWFWLGLQAGSILGAIFITWLFYESVYVIKGLCPYCIVVWSMVIPIFVYTTRYNIMENNIKLNRTWQGIAKWFCENAWFIVALWYLAIFTSILIQFWYYWKTLF